MNPEYLTRQLDILPMDNLNKKVIVIGAGAIGSFVVLTLAKMGFSNILVYDNDDVDKVNINCQFYPIADVGLPKVESLKKMVELFTGTIIKVKKERFDGNHFLKGDIVISAVDCMKARKDIFENAVSDWFIDSRMAAEYFTMFTVNNAKHDQIQSYKGTLYSNEEAVQERCTAKSTMYTVNMIAGFIGKAVKDIALGDTPIESLTFNVEKNSAVWFADGHKLTM